MRPARAPDPRRDEVGFRRPASSARPASRPRPRGWSGWSCVRNLDEQLPGRLHDRRRLRPERPLPVDVRVDQFGMGHRLGLGHRPLQFLGRRAEQARSRLRLFDDARQRPAGDLNHSVHGRDGGTGRHQLGWAFCGLLRMHGRPSCGCVRDSVLTSSAEPVPNSSVFPLPLAAVRRGDTVPPCLLKTQFLDTAEFRIGPGAKVRLDKHDPAANPGMRKQEGKAAARS